MSTTVELINYLDRAVQIKIKGDKFHEVLELVKNMPVRNYVKNIKSWVIPFGDLALFSNKAKTDIGDLKFIAGDSVKQKYFEHRDWKRKQLMIKADDKYALIDEIKDEMVVDERMYPFQMIGSYFLYKAGDALLCDMVGLGKSVQSLIANENHFKDKSINFTIIICPSTLKKNWVDEINTWTKNKTITVIGGTKTARKQQYKKAYKFDYMIINYDLLNYDIGMIDEYIIQKGFKYSIIIDEIQYIKNHLAKRSKHVKNISSFARFSIGLSATAIENSLLDLWSIFQGINETVFGGSELLWHFKDKYLILDFFGNPVDYKNEDAIKSRMAPYLIRRMKDQVLTELPDKIENNYWVDLSPEQQKFYDDISKQIVTEIGNQEKAEKIQTATVLPMITYLRQCVLSAKLVGHEKNISTKTTQLMDFIESTDANSKIVVFCHFVEMVEILKEILDKKGYKNICIHGKHGSPLHCPVDNRVAVIKQFNSGDYKILVTSDILTEGVNITSANYLVNFDILFNPAKMEQRIGRIDRIGNKHKTINIVNIIASNTIEQEVFEKVWKKRNMSIDIMDNNQQENRLTIKNIKSLLDIKH